MDVASPMHSVQEIASEYAFPTASSSREFGNFRYLVALHCYKMPASERRVGLLEALRENLLISCLFTARKAHEISENTFRF
jgi:hypothetical protein